MFLDQFSVVLLLVYNTFFSVTGYGFSDGAVRPGLNVVHVANIFKNLMDRIGFQRYYVQGGDWGAMIVQLMASLFPNKVIGMHSNMCFINSPLQIIKTIIGSYFPSLIGIPKDQAELVYPVLPKYANLILETGYMHLQATKPDTIGKFQ